MRQIQRYTFYVLFYLSVQHKTWVTLSQVRRKEIVKKNLTIFFSRQKIVDRMAESMDTSEMVADEDDRKLFVGGLPQVNTC